MQMKDHYNRSEEKWIEFYMRRSKKSLKDDFFEQ